MGFFMFSALKKFFKGPAKEQANVTPTFQKHFQFLIVDQGEEIEKNHWYRMSHWQSQHFLKMETEWDKDWKNFSLEEEVVGVTFEYRARKFLELGDQNNFKIFLEKDPDNPHDKNAIKVMGSVGNTVEQLGFLSKDTAKRLKNEKEIDARPYSVYLPYQGSKFGLRIRVLVRSNAFKKKNPSVYEQSEIKSKKSLVDSKSKAEHKKDLAKEKECIESLYEELTDRDTLETYEMKRPSKKIIKEAVKSLQEDGMSIEDIEFSIEEVVDRILEMNPDLEKDY